MTEAPDAKPGLLPLIGGVLLLVLSLALTWVAWLGYQHGVPGVPETPPEQSGAIVLYAPPDLEFDTVLYYSQRGVPTNELSADKLVMGATVKTARDKPFAIVAGFHGDARLVTGSQYVSEFDLAKVPQRERENFWPLGNDFRLFEGHDVAGPDLVQFRFDTARDGGKPGHVLTLANSGLAYPVFAADNSRVAVRTKRFEHVVRCRALGDPDFVKALSHQLWVDAGLRTCDRAIGQRPAINKGQKTTIVLTPACRSPRLDSAQRATGTSFALSWEFTDDAVAMVYASLTDLDEESRGQSYLFGSGVAVGLATSFFPGALKVLFDWSNRTRRWRRTGPAVGS